MNRKQTRAVIPPEVAPSMTIIRLVFGKSLILRLFILDRKVLVAGRDANTNLQYSPLVLQKYQYQELLLSRCKGDPSNLLFLIQTDKNQLILNSPKTKIKTVTNNYFRSTKLRSNPKRINLADKIRNRNNYVFESSNASPAAKKQQVPLNPINLNLHNSLEVKKLIQEQPLSLSQIKGCVKPNQKEKPQIKQQERPFHRSELFGRVPKNLKDKGEYLKLITPSVQDHIKKQLRITNNYEKLLNVKQVNDLAYQPSAELKSYFNETSMQSELAESSLMNRSQLFERQGKLQGPMRESRLKWLSSSSFFRQTHNFQR